MADASMDYLNSPAAVDLPAAACGQALNSLGEIQAKFTAAHAAFLRRFGAADAHDADGYGTSSAWLAAKTQLSVKDARAAVRRMRRLGERPHLADALGRGELSWSWAAEIIELTRKLPAELRGQTDRILLDAAARGATREDLRYLATCAMQVRVPAQLAHLPHRGPGVVLGHLGHRGQPRRRRAVPVGVMGVGGVEPAQEPGVRGGDLRLQLTQRRQHTADSGDMQLRCGGGVEVVQAGVRHAQRLGNAAGRLVAIGAHPRPPPRWVSPLPVTACDAFPSAPSTGLLPV